jgi:hypothetical protein
MNLRKMKLRITVWGLLVIFIITLFSRREYFTINDFDDLSSEHCVRIIFCGIKIHTSKLSTRPGSRAEFERVSGRIYDGRNKVASSPSYISTLTGAGGFRKYGIPLALSERRTLLKTLYAAVREGKISDSEGREIFQSIERLWPISSANIPEHHPFSESDKIRVRLGLKTRFPSKEI